MAVVAAAAVAAWPRLKRAWAAEEVTGESSRLALLALVGRFSDSSSFSVLKAAWSLRNFFQCRTGGAALGVSTSGEGRFFFGTTRDRGWSEEATEEVQDTGET